MSASQGHHSGAPPSTDPGGGRQQRALDQFHNFPFSSDEVFQQGLSGILTHQSVNRMSDNKQLELVLKTKVFYFNRITGHSISLEDVQGGYTADLDRFRAESGNEYKSSSEAQHGEMRTLSFAELNHLIEQGKTDDIPNNKTIPDTLNDGVPSESVVPLRRKPWELVSQS